MIGQQEVQIAGIILKSQFLQNIQPLSVQAEKGRPVAGDLRIEPPGQILFCGGELLPECFHRLGHRGSMMQPVQRQPVPVCYGIFQLILHLGGKSAYCKEGAFDAVLIQNADIRIKTVQCIQLHRCFVRGNTASVGKGFHIHSENRIFLFPHDISPLQNP